MELGVEGEPLRTRAAGRNSGKAILALAEVKR